MTVYNYALSNGFTRLENDLNDAKAELSAWESVHLVTKKDGTPFKNFSQNFKGEHMSIYVESWNIAPYEKTMAVYYRSKKGSQHSWLSCYRSIERDDNIDELDSDRIYKRGACLKDGYMFSPAEMMEQIDIRKQQIRRYIAELEDAIQRFDILKEALHVVCEQVEGLEQENKQLYYTAREILRAQM